PAGDPPWLAGLRERFSAREPVAAQAPAPAAAGAGAAGAARAGRRGGTIACSMISLAAARRERSGAGGAAGDLALSATASADAPEALRRAAGRGARAAVIFERCHEERLAHELVALARSLQVRVVGPGSMGFMIPPVKFDASRLGALPAAGNVALVSQSGVLAGDLLDWAGGTAIGFSLIVSLGLEADIDLAQVLDYLADDSRTKAVVVYLEAVSEARGFMSALRVLASVKPVVVLKAGRDAATASAPRTHSGALAAADAVYSAALRRAGAVQIRLFTQLFTAVRYLAARSWPVGKRLSIVSNGH